MPLSDIWEFGTREPGGMRIKNNVLISPLYALTILKCVVANHA